MDPAWEFKEFPEAARRMRDLDADNWLNAAIPSSVYTCLENAGVISIPDLSPDFNDIQWVDQKSWVFRKEFDVPPALLEKERVEIIFDGLDTVAHIWLNEKLIGKTENMFIPHRFDIKPYLKQSRNKLYIKLVSALHHTNRLLHRYGKLGRHHLRDPRSAYIRKAAYQFGSEFGPARTGCGIVRDVRIEGSNIATIENLHLRTIDCNQHTADIRVALELNQINSSRGPLTGKIRITGGGLKMEHELLFENEDRTLSTILHIERPFLWWPIGYGVPHLYHINIELLTKDGQLLDRVSEELGVRTMSVESSSGKTECIINGQPIALKGTDWLPPSLFPGTKTDYQLLLKRAKECRLNLLRVRADGTYENPEFYNLCDRMGILVWQDFMFDSAYYPDRQWFLNSVKNEAEAVIKKLRNHACIALWCGNNNIDWLHKNGKLGKGRKFYGKPIFHKLLPKLINELDPDREYIPTRSCCNSENQTLVADTPAIPSPPCLVTLRDSKHFKDSFGVLEQLTHSSSALEKIAQCQIAEFLPPKNLSEYIRQSQVVQARQAKHAAETFRAFESFGGGCMAGAFNDFALSISPSMLDSLKQPKALYYYARRFFAPILVTILPDEKTGILKAYIVNDSTSPVTGMLTCQMTDTEGRLLDTVEKPIRISPFSKTTAINLPKSFTTPDDPSRSFLYISVKNNGTLIAENTHFYCPDKQFKWPIADLDIEINPEKDKNIWNVTLTSQVPVRDLQIIPPQPAKLSNNFLTLLPNQPKTIQIAFEDTAPSTQIPIQLYSVNQSLNPN